MDLLWITAGMLMAQQGFRRANGHIYLPNLVDALDWVYDERTGRKPGRATNGPERVARVA